jgi:hypothetical protein
MSFFNKFNNSRFSNPSPFIYILFVSIVIFESFIKYYGLEYSYDYGNYLENGSKYYTNDIFLNKEGVYSSIFYDVFKYNLENDILGFVIYLLSNLVAVYYFYKILVEFFTLEKIDTFFLIIILGLLSHFILPEVKSALFRYGFAWHTSFGYNLIFPLIYYTLKNQIYLKSFFIFFSILVSIKQSLLIVCTCVLYQLIFTKKWRNFFLEIILIIISIGILYYKLNLNGIVGTNGSVDVLQNYINSQGNESFLLQNKYYNILFFFITLIIFPFVVHILKINKKIKYFLYVLLFSVIINGILNIFYEKFISFFIYSSKYLIIDFIVFLSSFQLFFLVALFKFFKQNNLNNLMIITFFTFCFFWRWSDDIIFNKYYALSFLLVSFILALINKKIIEIKFLKKDLFILCAAILITSQYTLSEFSKRIDRFSEVTFSNIGKFYSRLKNYPMLEQKLIKLRNCDDFILFFLEKSNSTWIDSAKNDNTLKINLDANVLSKKSKFLIYDCRGMFSEEKLNECNNRKKIYLNSIKNFTLPVVDNVLIKNNYSLIIISDTNIKKLLKQEDFINLKGKNKNFYFYDINFNNDKTKKCIIQKLIL